MTNTVIKSVNKLDERDFEVELEVKNGKTSKIEKVRVNTILMAIGRDPNPSSYAAEKAGIELDSVSLKIMGRSGERERTNVDHIYAVGDVVLGVPELMPVAQKSGKLLAHRLSLRLSKSGEPQVSTKIDEKTILANYSTDYNLIPTTVFSPTEYSFVGLSEEEAERKYGTDDIDIYHRETTPL